MFKKILLTLGLITSTAFGGSLQDSDFATSAAITGAGGTVSQLLNSSKMYNSVDAEIMNTSIARWNAKLSSPVDLTTQVTSVLPSANGGTGFSSYTNGQLAIGSTTSGGLVKSTITAGSGISVTNAPGSITIAATGGSGTVTSVAFSDGSSTPIFTITGSPVTTNGTLTETLSTQTANKVFAGPTSGGAAQPTFRTLVAADIPSTFTYGQEVPGGTVDNSNVTFTLAHTPKAAAAVSLYLDGLILNQGVDYTISSATITMTVAPNFNQKIYATYQY